MGPDPRGRCRIQSTKCKVASRDLYSRPRPNSTRILFFLLCQPEACAGAVLRCTETRRARTAPAITPNLVGCVFNHSIINRPARASPKSPGPLANHRRPSPILANLVFHAILHAAHACGTPSDAPRRPLGSFFFSCFALAAPFRLNLFCEPRDPPRPRPRLRRKAEAARVSLLHLDSTRLTSTLSLPNQRLHLW